MGKKRSASTPPPITGKQISYLEHLGYKGSTKKLNRWEASDLIDNLKAGNRNKPSKKTSGCAGCAAVCIMIPVLIWSCVAIFPSAEKQSLPHRAAPRPSKETTPAPVPQEQHAPEPRDKPEDIPPRTSSMSEVLSQPQTETAIEPTVKPYTPRTFRNLHRNEYPLRTWTDTTGKHKTEARFHSITGDKVRLVKADGKDVRLPLAKLSPADQKWIKDRKR